MKKKLLSLLLCLATALTVCLMLPGGTSVAMAETSCPGSGTASDPWIISVAGAQTKMQAVYTASNHTLTISISGGSNSSMIDFGIMTGNGITNYYYPWSDVRTEIEKVVIGSGVNNISRYAFYGCTGLKEVVIADSVERISEHAFNGCQSLTSVQMPAKLKRISVGAFTNCTSLTSVTLPEGLEDIWTRAFYNCTSLASVNIPSTTKDISEGAFYGTKLSGTITIPASVTTLEGGAFANCKSISAFSVASSNTKYCSVDGVIFTKDQKTLVHAPGKLRSGYTLPSTLPVETIGEFAFRGCNIPTVTLSSTVKTIGEGAFQDCTRLKTVMLENSVTTIGANAFAGCTGLNALPDQSGVTGYVKYNGTRQQRDARLTIDNTGNGNTPLLDALWLYNACDPADHEHSGWASNETEHYHVCKLCRARYDQTAHTYAVVSGVATCTICGYEKTVATITVTYDANGGTGTMAPETLVKDNETMGVVTTYRFPECGFTAPDGKKFDHWEWRYTDDTILNSANPGSSPWLTGNIIVKAVWKDSEASFLKGDVNNDGKVNQKDVARLRQFLADNAAYPMDAPQNADVNNDGKINQKDVARLRQYLADSKVYPLG